MSILIFNIGENLEVAKFSDMPIDGDIKKLVAEGQAIIKKARLFYPGTHNNKKFVEADIRKIADNFVTGEFIPLQLDHSDSARDTIGRILDVFQEGDTLYGHLLFLGEDAVKNVLLGKWKKVSIGARLKDKKLVEVSITPFPALTDAEIFSMKGEIELSNTAGKVKGQQDATPEKVEVQTDKTDFKVEKIEGKEEFKVSEFRELQANFVQLHKMFTESEKEKMTLKASLEETQKQLRFKTDEDYIETFARSGKTTPAMKDAETKLYHSLDEEQRKLFVAFKESSPVIVDFKMHNSVNAQKPGDDKVKDEEDIKLMAQYADKMNNSLMKSENGRVYI